MFCIQSTVHNHSSGAVWESRWPSWAVRPNEPSGFHGRKEILNRASALVTTCPQYVNWHLRTLSITSSSSYKAQSPGEIKRREVSWTLTKKLDTFAGPGEIKRREVVLDPQVSPEEIKSREVELGAKSWTSLASVTQRQCYRHCPCDCSTQQLKQQLCGTVVAANGEGTLP